MPKLGTLGPKCSGVYCIRNLQNNKVYVGSSQSIRGRWREHRYTLRLGTHHNRFLQRAWNKYGESSFEFRVLELCPTHECAVIEQKCIDKARSSNPRHGYNLCPIANSVRGLKWTAKQRAKKRPPISEETRKKLSLASLGKTHKVSEETRRALSKIAKLRPPMSQETRDKLSIAGKGRKHSEETKKKMSKAAIGHQTSIETRAKISAANTGKTQSPTARRKNSEAQRLRYLSAEERARTALLTSKAIHSDPEKMANRVRAGKLSWAVRSKQC